MKCVLACLMLLLAGSLHAQCLAPSNSSIAQPSPWPTLATYTPANPAAGAGVSVELGAPNQAFLVAPVVTVSGSTITLSGQMDSYAILPPPPVATTTLLGAFPSGTYTVRVRLTSAFPGFPACNPLDSTLVVGNGIAVAAPVPVNAWLPLALLVLAMLLARSAWRRKPGRAPD